MGSPEAGLFRAGPTCMDEKVKERRRSVRREQGKRRAGILVVVAALVVVVALFAWLRSSDVFAVQRITATPVTHISSEQLAEAAAGAQGESLLALSVDPIEEALRSLPYVRSAQVLRRFPNTLEVRVSEHTAAARVEVGDGAQWLVSADGRFLEVRGGATGNALDLPLFVPASSPVAEAGSYVPEAVERALSLATLLSDDAVAEGLPEVDHIGIALTGEVVVHLQDGVELRLGEPTELERKLIVATSLVQQYLRDGRDLRYVDASVPDRVAVNAQ